MGCSNVYGVGFLCCVGWVPPNKEFEVVLNYDE